MADILDKFIEKARENVASGYYGNVKKAAVKKASLKKRLESGKFTLIAEIKHASPAGEYSFDDIDVEKTARSFLANGADAISVVVEPKIFKGDISNVAIAKSTGLPVLFKDFVISEKQVDAAAASGADAMLLVVKVATRTGMDLGKMIDYAHKQGLEVLLECYDREEMEIALASKADIVGINNRDLQTLHVDLGRTGRIMGQIGKIQKPLISESGVKERKDVEFLKGFGANGVLVGTAIWKAADLGAKIRELKMD
ncbi:MAG: indole-3-glycerol phosphate synthase TrpC [Candidatus Micrarchaeia archaeon]